MDLMTIPFAFPGLDTIACAFCTRNGTGASAFSNGNVSLDVGDDPDAVRANRRRLQDSLGFTSWQEVLQVHGSQIIFDPEPGNIDKPGSIEADGLATARKGQALVIKTADCQPILLAHTSGNYVAALHSGWRGCVDRFPSRGLRAFCREYDLDPADIMAVRGPSLGPGQSQFTNFAQEFGREFEQYYDPQTQTVDLWHLTREQLLGAGLPPRNIFSLDMCTNSLPDLFFSYRRQKTCGRQASIIWIR